MRPTLFKTVLVLAAALGCLYSVVGQTPTPRIVGYVELALKQGDLAGASALVAQYRRLNGDTPDALEALSWVARGQLATGDKTTAKQTAEEIKRIARTSLSTRNLDSEPHLPLALGAAYEVEAEILAQDGKRAEALQSLQAALKEWRTTSLADRLQKNINLLTLLGRPMPVLRETQWIGSKPPAPGPRRAKASLLFFWAHWCADCKAEAPIIARLAEEFEPKGLAIIAPTRFYGYTAEDENATPDAERAFIEKVFARYYAAIPNVRVPLDAGNFQRFGASTTPTIVLVDGAGKVRLYHPGVMDEASLRTAIEKLLADPRKISA